MVNIYVYIKFGFKRTAVYALIIVGPRMTVFNSMVFGTQWTGDIIFAKF